MRARTAVSALLAELQKRAGVRLAETRQREDGTTVKILVGKLPIFPHGERPTWYPLVLRRGQDTIDRKEVEAILRHFWNAQITIEPTKPIKHSKVALKRK